MSDSQGSSDSQGLSGGRGSSSAEPDDGEQATTPLDSVLAPSSATSDDAEDANTTTWAPAPASAAVSAGVPTGMPAFSGTTPVGTTSRGTTAAGGMPQDAPISRPRVRVGAIVWGALVVAFAVAVVAITASPEATDAFSRWQASLTPGAWAVIGVVALGVVVLLIAGTAAIRGAQRRSAAR